MVALVAFWAGATAMRGWRPIGNPIAQVPGENQSASNLKSTRDNSIRSHTALTNSEVNPGTHRYYLRSDIPELKSRIEEQTRTAAEARLAGVRDEYISLYGSLGVDGALQLSLLDHIKQIYKAKILAFQALDELNQARIEYDRRIEAALGSNYAAYISIEAEYSARRELDAFERYMEPRGILVDANVRPNLVKLIHKHEAYSFRTMADLGGIYNDIPKPFGGKQSVPILQSHLSSLTESSLELVQSTIESGLGNETASALRHYYDERIAHLQRLVERAKDPMQSAIRVLEAQLETLKSNPESDPEAIARAQAQLDGAISYRDAKLAE